MQRYFIPADKWVGDQIQLGEEHAHHLRNVLRAAVGDRFIVSDGISRDAICQIISMDKQNVLAEVVEQLPRDQEPIIDVWIAQSLPKADKMDWIVQKCTELGARGFIPFISERTIVQYDRKKEAKRLERWLKIATEAAEQSGRNRIPAIEYPIPFDKCLSRISDFDVALLCYEKSDGSGIKQCLQQIREEFQVKGRSLSIVIVIGPEGGFSDREAHSFMESGCRIITLGKRILRTETAGLVALTSVLYEFEELEG